MKTLDSASIIWVGRKGGEVFQRLAADQRRRGRVLDVCEQADQLPEVLSRAPRVVVVVRDGDETTIEQTLSALGSVYRPVPVVVLVEESTFGRYYDLMGRGARFYYELSEGPDRIARAVQYTAAHAA